MSRNPPVCLECRLQMRCVLNGQLLNDLAVGQWDSTYWETDIFQCDRCKRSIAAGFGTAMTPTELRLLDLDLSPSIPFARDEKQLQKYGPQMLAAPQVIPG